MRLPCLGNPVIPAAWLPRQPGSLERNCVTGGSRPPNPTAPSAARIIGLTIGERNDIVSGRIADVKRGYGNREGDYLFVIAGKGTRPKLMVRG